MEEIPWTKPLSQPNGESYEEKQEPSLSAFGFGSNKVVYVNGPSQDNRETDEVGE
jgi:hypothetical protein